MKSLYSNFEEELQTDFMRIGETPSRGMVAWFIETNGNQSANIIQMGEVADVIDGKPIYDTLWKPDIGHPWIYAGQCHPGEIRNKCVALMPIVYICSRFRAKTREELERNIKVAKWGCKRAIKQGKIPFAPHLYLPRFLDDAIESEREFALNAGKRFLQMCTEMDVITIDGVISEGMNGEIDYFTNTLMRKAEITNFVSEDVDEILREIDRLER